MLLLFLLFSSLSTTCYNLAQLEDRLLRQERIVSLQASRIILELIKRQRLEPENREIERRMPKIIASYERQMKQTLRHFFATEVSESTPESLVQLVLFLLQEDHTLLQCLSTEKRETLLHRIDLYYRTRWPAKKTLLEEIVRDASLCTNL